MVLHAPAKVNLHLDIKGLRADGYHEILSIVQTVPLFDEVRIRSLKHSSDLRVYCNPPLHGAENIAETAAGRFRRLCAVKGGLDIRIEKRIPVGAGLGGGSSDAAAVLMGLNRMMDSPLSDRRLRTLGAGLGSDVPLFMGHSAALVSGRGEVIQPLVPRRDLVIVLVFPGISISTTRAYAWYDAAAAATAAAAAAAALAGHGPTDKQLKECYESESPERWVFFNSFQDVIEQRYPLIKQIVSQINACGAQHTAISGSGSSVFGVFTDARAAGEACKRMLRDGLRAWTLVPLKSEVAQIMM